MWNGYQSVRNRHVKTALYQHAKSKVELIAENEELWNRVNKLEDYIKSITENGAHIVKCTCQSDMQEIAIRLRKKGQGGWLYFVEDRVPKP